MTSRTFFILVLFLEVHAALCAQKSQGSWSDLRGLWEETQNIKALSDGLAIRSQRDLTRSSGISLGRAPWIRIVSNPRGTRPSS